MRCRCRCLPAALPVRRPARMVYLIKTSREGAHEIALLISIESIFQYADVSVQL